MKLNPDLNQQTPVPYSASLELLVSCFRPKLKRLGASSGSESDKDAEQVDFRGVLTSKWVMHN